jgi:hypothetical protein
MKKLAPVDDYMGAIGPRARSVRLLIRNDRRTAAQHIGGMVVECVIKSGVVFYHGMTHWQCKTHPSQPENPMHDLKRAMTLLPTATQTMLASHVSFLSAIDLIQNPPDKFISYAQLRYEPSEPSDAGFQQWRDAYKEVLGRLHESLKITITTRSWRR